MQYGGKTQYGGTSQFGSEEEISSLYYRVLKDLALPGCWSRDDDALINRLLYVDAVGCEHGQLHATRMEYEQFPHTTVELISDWESILGVRPKAGATIDERVAAVVAVWRASQRITLEGIRKTLDPLINSSYFFRDYFNDDELSYRYKKEGSQPTFIEGSGTLIITNAISTGYGTQTIKIPDMNDDFTLTARVSTYSLANDTSFGIIAKRGFSGDNGSTFIRVGIAGVFGSPFIEAFVDSEGITESVGFVAAPLGPFNLSISRVGDLWTISCDGLGTPTIYQFTANIKVSDLGFFNNMTSGASSISYDYIKMSQGKSYNNVEIIENTTDNIADDDHIFIAAVQRWPEDAGTYDIKNVQRILDRIKLAHTVIFATESCFFECDDSASLCDRDLLGV